MSQRSPRDELIAALRDLRNAYVRHRVIDGIPRTSVENEQMVLNADRLLLSSKALQQAQSGGEAVTQPKTNNDFRRLGFRDGLRHAVTWLHARAKNRKDPDATQILDSAATNLGWTIDSYRAHMQARDCVSTTLADECRTTPLDGGVTEEQVERASRQYDPELWSMIDKYATDDDWNGGTSLNARHIAMTKMRAALSAALKTHAEPSTKSQIGYEPRSHRLSRDSE